MKTTIELNQKIWYRLLKVFYVIIFLCATSLSIYLTFDEYAPIFSAYQAKCNDQKIINLSEIEITTSFISPNEYNRISLACLSNKDLGETAKIFYPEYDDLSDEELGEKIHNKMKSGFNFDLLDKVKIITKNYDLIPIYTTRDWWHTIQYTLLSILTSLFIFELARRLFYYVILGTIRPKR